MGLKEKERQENEKLIQKLREERESRKKDKAKMFTSFENDSDAQMFKINIQNYSEVDAHVQELKVRKMILELLDPVVAQSNLDRAFFQEIEKQSLNTKNRLIEMEDIVYQRERATKSSVFTKIIATIKDVDRLRMKDYNKIQEQFIEI